MKSLLVRRVRCRKTPHPKLPWRVECGCGSRIDNDTFVRALFHIRKHLRGDHSM